MKCTTTSESNYRRIVESLAILVPTAHHEMHGRDQRCNPIIRYGQAGNGLKIVGYLKMSSLTPKHKKLKPTPANSDP